MTWRDAVPSLALVALFAFVLPVRIPEPSAAVSRQSCLTLAERAPRQALPGASTLEQCLALYPADVELLADLAAVYAGTAPARAEAALRRAIAVDDANGELRLRLGRMLLERGASAEAAEQAALGLRVQPNRPELIALQRAAGARPPAGF
jgi:hypothetical protein